MSSVIPVYIMLGDDLIVGNHCDETFTTALESPTLTNTVRNSGQKIYNRTTTSVVAYNAHDNSNTSGTAPAAPQPAGPEFSLTLRLFARHSSTGFVIIKRGSNSSTLIASDTAYSAGTGGRWSKTYASTEHYDELGTDITNAFDDINTTLGKQAEVMGFFVSLGTHDQTVDGGGALFTTELPIFVQNLRTDYGTHTTGKATPVIWRRPSLTASGAISAEATSIRTALTKRAQADKQFRVLDADDIELASDNLSEIPTGTITVGDRYDAELNYIALPNC
jgi:hypothetical protein